LMLSRYSEGTGTSAPSEPSSRYSTRVGWACSFSTTVRAITTPCLLAVENPVPLLLVMACTPDAVVTPRIITTAAIRLFALPMYHIRIMYFQVLNPSTATPPTGLAASYYPRPPHGAAHCASGPPGHNRGSPTLRCSACP